jgi:hypothetical protein
MTSETPRPGPNRVRASDTEREQIAEVVRAAMTDGRLNLAEGEERLAAVYAAKYRDELAPLTADLPDGGRAPVTTEDREREAAFRGHLRRHAGLVAVVAAVLTGLWALSGAEFFWPAIPLIFLVVGLSRHARYGYWAHGHNWRHNTPAGRQRW